MSKYKAAEKTFEFFYDRLVRGYKSVMGKEPEGLDKIKIKQEAKAKQIEANKVIEVDFGEPFAELIKKGEITKGTAFKTPPYTPSKSQTDFEIQTRLESDNAKAIESFKKRNPKEDMVNPERDSFKKISNVLGAFKRYRRGEKDPALNFNQFFELFSKENFATGGRAGYYGGGMTNMVGEDLSEIGHGSDALMARNMQLAPNGQATTSTGLNYLLGQDNDTVRIPYKGGGGADASTTSFSKSYDRQHGTNTASRANKSVDAQQAADQRHADIFNDRISNTDRGREQTLNNYITVNSPPEQKQNIIDRIKNSKYNNPYTRGIAKLQPMCITLLSLAQILDQ